MAELTPQERLQPSLLDRLTDDEPEKQVESRDRRVLSIERLRESVMRDLEWLLNSSNLSQTFDLRDYSYLSSSVLNYGVPDLAGCAVSRADVMQIERSMRQAVLDFEPRILRNTVKVRAQVADQEMSHNTLSFEIQGELWAEPVPMRLFLRTEVDLETGIVSLAEQLG